MVSFNNSVGGDNYGPINQAGRDVDVGVSFADAIAATGRLPTALAGVDIPAGERRAVEADLDGIERELRGPEPDRQRTAARLERLTKTLHAAGALAAAGGALLGPIGAIAGFLGPAATGLADLVRR